MSAESELQLQRLTNEVKIVEKMLEEKLKLIVNKQDIVFDRNMDYGQRGFSMDVYFDEINMLAFTPENINNIKFYLVKYNDIRKKQRALELEILAERKVRDQNIEVKDNYDIDIKTDIQKT